MKKPNITLGPWKQDNTAANSEQEITISRSWEQGGASVCLVESSRDHRRLNADARAIAALPSVYEAASNMVFEASITDHGENYVEVSRKNYAALISALKQAGYEF